MIRWAGTSLYDKKPQYVLHTGKTDAIFGSQNRINQQSLMRLGARLYTLAPCDAMDLPKRLPICAGRVHAVRRVSPDGQVRFLNQTLHVGKRYRERYVWLTLETAHQRLSIWYQARAGAPWKRLKTVEALLNEPVVAVLKRFARLHAARQPRARG